MADYSPPLSDMRFVLRHQIDLASLSTLAGHEEFSIDVAEAVLEEAGRFASSELSPLNQPGDVVGAKWHADAVTTTPGWKQAYEQFIEAGWNSLSADSRYGGQGLPQVMSTLVGEMWNSANMAFTLCPILTQGASEAIQLKGSDAIKDRFLPNMVQGRWSGAMDLTEPQAGSDLAAVRTRAVPERDGTYRLYGQKIFITYGEHDLTENIIHLVLARTPDAPEGVKGISLFVAPKFLVNADGSVGKRNDVVCGSIEHKLGIHGSPTCTMNFGAGDGAVAYLVGEENRGLEYMFIMMNAARFSVGVQGLGIAQRAYQSALEYASERVQGVSVTDRHGGKVVIRQHPDVQRMLMLMRAQTEAMRAVAAVVAQAIDLAQGHANAAERVAQQSFVDLMIPVVKGWMTETAIEVASLGIQVHGGMGYIEETGAAQHLRDARITTIYEGTTGIQAADLVGRKIVRDRGAAARALLAAMRTDLTELQQIDEVACTAIATHLRAAIEALEQAVEFVLEHAAQRMDLVLAASAPLLKLFGIVAGGWQMGRAAGLATTLDGNDDEHRVFIAKRAVARFYAEHLLSQAPALLVSVRASESALARVDDSAA